MATLARLELMPVWPRRVDLQLMEKSMEWVLVRTRMSIFSRRTSSSAREDLEVGCPSKIPSLPCIFQVPILKVRSLSLMGEAMASDLGP